MREWDVEILFHEKESIIILQQAFTAILIF